MDTKDDGGHGDDFDCTLTLWSRMDGNMKLVWNHLKAFHLCHSLRYTPGTDGNNKISFLN